MGQVVDRIGLLLGAFNHQDPRLTLSECADRAGLSKSSAHRLLTSLVEIGLLERDANGLWQIGELPLQLAGIRISSRSMKSEVMPALVALGEHFKAATAFSVPRGDEMVYIERTQSSEAFGVSARLGSTALMWTGASGRAVLAAYSPEAREERLQSASWKALPAEEQQQIRAELSAAEERGYAVDRGGYFDGVAGVAAALGSPGDPVAAIGLMTRPEQMTPELEREMGERVAQLARDTTRRTSIPTGLEQVE